MNIGENVTTSLSSLDAGVDIVTKIAASKVSIDAAVLVVTI